DWEHLLLPDALTLPLALGGLAATWALEPEALTDHAAAAALGYGALRLLGAAYRRLRGRDGLGQGDAKLVCAAGAWVGLAGLPWAITGAGALGLLMAAALRLRGTEIGTATRLPFGTPLALAIWLVWLYVPG
ncbi:MAG: prepilin peptidase, partial [Proteobacteria bacterium]|nr:prepilin peptidase [Pseudomonadota bacterium]